MGHGIDALFRLTVTWKLFGQTCENVFYFRAKDTDVSDTTDEDVGFMIGDTKNWVIDPMLDFMSSDCQLMQSDAVCLSPAGGPFATHLWDGVYGVRTGHSLPSYVAAVVSSHTGYSGRRTHGRTYLCGVPNDDYDQNILTAGGLTRLQNAANSWLSRYGRDGSSSRWWGVVFSRSNGVVRDPGPPPVLHYSPLAGVPWRNMDARNELFTQRHRLLGRGI